VSSRQCPGNIIKKLVAAGTKRLLGMAEPSTLIELLSCPRRLFSETMIDERERDYAFEPTQQLHLSFPAQR
jgi:hypothetical protein